MVTNSEESSPSSYETYDKKKARSYSLSNEKVHRKHHHKTEHSPKQSASKKSRRKSRSRSPLDVSLNEHHHRKSRSSNHGSDNHYNRSRSLSPHQRSAKNFSHSRSSSPTEHSRKYQRLSESPSPHQKKSKKRNSDSPSLQTKHRRKHSKGQHHSYSSSDIDSEEQIKKKLPRDHESDRVNKKSRFTEEKYHKHVENYNANGLDDKYEGKQGNFTRHQRNRTMQDDFID
ncbi:CLK4-associating serine/arginine rich protein-like, partial [Stegodyphus dumicola]|uniref:CLK4-associating serine/arginine rich protein-like n=1 Tax=Stegodyphus dumicola TaxID=202533 RepID=UPI0015AEF97A